MNERVRLFSFRITNFKPDQTSSTAHTLISTSPIGSATSRIVSSVISVFTPEDFFGQETQITPSGTILVRYDFSFAFSSNAEVAKRWTKAISDFGRVSHLTWASAGKARKER